MSTSGISLGTSAAQAPNPSAFQQRKQDFKNLSDALQSGDLNAAQQAYAALQKDAPPRPAGQGQQSGQQQGGSSGNSAKDAFDALGKAQQSGDLSGAQQAFSQLQNDVKQGRGAHHHHHGGSSASSSDTSTGTVDISNGSINVKA